MLGTRTLALACLASLGAGLGVGCGAERAALVSFEPEPDGDALCVWAWGEGDQVFSERYPTDREARRPEGGSLTFVAGSSVASEVVIGARVLRGGAMVGEGRLPVRFGEGLTEHTLRVARCAPFDGAVPLPLSIRGRFASPVDRMAAGDVDGDGRDELVAITADGGVHVLHADTEASGSLVTAMAPAGLGAVALADFEGDCAADLVALSDRELRVVSSVAIEPTVGDAALMGARDAAPGSPTGQASLVLVDAMGLSVQPRGAGSPLSVAGSFTSVVVDDFDRDGRDDVVASGAAGTRFFLGGDGALTERPDALPPRLAAATGPLARLDLDGDGAPDLAVSEGSVVRLAINRGDGLLEERAGGAPAALPGPAARLRAGDVDGDCRDEVIAIGADGAVTVFRLIDGVVEPIAEAWPFARDAAVVDLDGDGARELALLTPEGEVRRWRP